jgi:hypothetical protein
MICCVPSLAANAQVLDFIIPPFEAPLSITNVMLPIGHAPVNFTCSIGPGEVQEIRYWQRNVHNEGIFLLKARPGQAPPASCDKVILPHPAPHFVSCFLYPGVMLKEQNDEGDEGVAGVSLIVLKREQAVPPCSAAQAPGEVLVVGPGLNGFWGAAGGYVFLAGEKYNGLFGDTGLGVLQTSAPGRIFEATMYDVPSVRMNLVPGGLNLRFATEYSENCSVWNESAASRNCLARMAKAAGASISLTDCLRTMKTGHFAANPDPRIPTALEYPTVLTLRGATAKLRSTGPAIACIAAK